MMTILIACMLATGALWHALRVTGGCLLAFAAVAAVLALMFVTAYGT